MSSALVKYKNNCYYLDTYCLENYKRQRKTFTELSELAIYLYKIATGDVNIPRANTPTVEDIIDSYISFCVSVKKVSKNYVKRMLVAKKALTPILNNDAAMMSRSTIDDYIKERLKSVKPATAKQEYLLLHAAYNYAVSRDLLAKNPIAKYWIGIKLKPKINDVPEQKQLQKLIDAIKDIDIKKAVYFLLATGSRVSEMLSLHCDDIVQNDTTAVIRIKFGKGSKERIITVPRLPFECAKTSFAFEYKGKRLNYKTLRTKLKQTCKAVGITLNIHDLRKTHATYCLAAGEDIYSIMTRCGWNSIAMLQRYAQFSARYRNDGQWLPRF